MCDKAVEDKSYYANQAKVMGAQSPFSQLGYSPNHRASPMEEMQRQQEEADRATGLRREGLLFLRENPAFNQFIELIRKGAIGI